MPLIARFQGIVITMYHEAGRHQYPHFHARYGEHRASFTINPPTLLIGAMPRRQQHLILAWAELRSKELMENWQLAAKEQTLKRIDGIS